MKKFYNLSVSYFIVLHNILIKDISYYHIIDVFGNLFVGVSRIFFGMTDFT